MKSVATTISKSTLILFVSAVMAAVLLVSMLLIGTQTVAWFRAYDEEAHPAKISNFVTTVQYSLNGGSLADLKTGEAIPVDVKLVNGTWKVDEIQIHVNFQSAHHQAYLRVSVFGGFYNANTGTYLPLAENCWSFDNSSSTKWMIPDNQTPDNHLYYNELLKGNSNENELYTTSLDPFSMSVTLPNDISKHQSYKGELFVIVDAVQPNRYKELWGIEKLPWETQ